MRDTGKEGLHSRALSDAKPQRRRDAQRRSLDTGSHGKSGSVTQYAEDLLLS